MIAEKETKLFMLEYNALTNLLQTDPDIARIFFKNTCFTFVNRIKRASDTVVVESIEKILNFDEIQKMKDPYVGVILAKSNLNPLPSYERKTFQGL